MLQTFKRILRFFMPDEINPNIHFLFPEDIDEVNVLYWCTSVLLHDFASVSSNLTRLEHCKADKSPKHEFLVAYITLDTNGTKRRTCMIIDRSPAIEVEPFEPFEPSLTVQKTQSLSSLISSPSAVSSTSSLSPSQSTERLKAILGQGGSVAATDRIVIPSFRRHDGILTLAKGKFGSYKVLNTLDVREGQMSAPQLATVLKIVHNLAPNYTLRKHQCYWFALLVFLVVRRKTGGHESNSDTIVKRGTLYGLKPEHSAGDDEMVAMEEYERAWTQFLTVQQVSHLNLVR